MSAVVVVVVVAVVLVVVVVMFNCFVVFRFFGTGFYKPKASKDITPNVALLVLTSTYIIPVMHIR